MNVSPVAASVSSMSSQVGCLGDRLLGVSDVRSGSRRGPGRVAAGADCGRWVAASARVSLGGAAGGDDEGRGDEQASAGGGDGEGDAVHGVLLGSMGSAA